MSQRRWPPVIPAGSTPSQTDASAPTSSRPSAKTRGQPFALRVSVIIRAHLAKAGSANDAEVPPSRSTQSAMPAVTAACRVRAGTSPSGSGTSSRFLYDPTRARAASMALRSTVSGARLRSSTR